MMLVKWEADPDRGEESATQCRYLLDPDKWQGSRKARGRDAHRLWRYNPAELGKQIRASASKRKRKHGPCLQLLHLGFLLLRDAIFGALCHSSERKGQFQMAFD